MPALPVQKDASFTKDGASSIQNGVSSSAQPPQSPPVTTPIPKPLARLRIEDLSSQGAKIFLETFDIGTMIPKLIDTVFKILIPEATEDLTPPVRSITLVLEDFDGIAFACGNSHDDLQKEIHLSTSYIAGTTKLETRESEIIGVLVHEMVHLWQWNGQGKASGGLIEGLADWVRLKAGFVVPHWRKRTDGVWDMGYDGTAYFLDRLEEQFGKGFVVRLNQKLREEYVEGTFWEELCGVGNGVDVLWREYGKTLE